MTPGEIALWIWFAALLLGAFAVIGLFIAYWLTKPTSYRDLEP